MNVVLTGATGGIGRAIARALHLDGARLFLTGRDMQRLQMLEQELHELRSAPVHSRAVDFTDSNAAHELAREVITNFDGVVDVLINNAGIGYHASIEHIDPLELEETFRVNVFAPILLCSLLLPALRDSGRGHVIVMSSILGAKVMRYTASYAASKHAIEGFSKTLRVEAAPHVRVTLVEPGAVDTPFLSRTHELLAATSFSQRSIQKISPQEIAEWVRLAVLAPPSVCPELIRISPSEQVL